MSKLLTSLLLLSFTLLANAQPGPPSAPGTAGRLGGPMSIASIKLVVGHPTYGTSRQRVVLGRAPAAITATFVAVGGGMVAGHWELAVPADGIPTTLDLTPTPLLSNNARMQQRRFRQKETFGFSLSPGERYVLKGPAINANDLSTIGRYHVVLKIDSVSSINTAAATMPSRVAPIVLEVEAPRPTTMPNPPNSNSNPATATSESRQ